MHGSLNFTIALFGRNENYTVPPRILSPTQPNGRRMNFITRRCRNGRFPEPNSGGLMIIKALDLGMNEVLFGTILSPLRGSFLVDCTHICFEPRQGFNFIFYSTPSGLEFFLAHNPELSLGAIHIQALRACVGI